VSAEYDLLDLGKILSKCKEMMKGVHGACQGQSNLTGTLFTDKSGFTDAFWP